MTAANEKPEAIKAGRKSYFCPRCNTKLTDRVSRGILVKIFLFWMPARRFVCYTCRKKTHFFNWQYFGVIFFMI